VPRVHQVHLKAARVQDLVQRNPIDAGGLHGDGRDPTVLEPVGEAMEIGGEAVKSSHRCGVAIGPHGDVVRAVAHVDARGVGMHHGESGIDRLQAAGERSALLAGQP
jgi:hypothetical protein